MGKLWASSKLFNSFRMLVAVFFSMSSANNQTGCVACATQKLHGLCPYGSRGYQFSLKVAVAWMLGKGFPGEIVLPLVVGFIPAGDLPSPALQWAFSLASPKYRRTGAG